MGKDKLKDDSGLIDSASFTFNELSLAQTSAMSEFKKDPLRFMLRNVVQPTSTAQTGDIKGTTTVVDRFMNKDTDTIVAKADVHLLDAGQKIRFMFLEPLNGGFSLKVKQMPAEGYEPIYFLPWASQCVVRLTIDAMPTKIAKTDADVPRFFFTSGLSGCSVFIKGSDESPTIWHAGTDGFAVVGNSDKFWKQQLLALEEGLDKKDLKQLGKADYLSDDRASLQNYLAWLDAPDTRTLKLQIYESTACVFGVRTGKKWKFYVQEHMVSSVVRLVDRSQVRSEMYLGDKIYKSATTGARALLETRIKVPKRFGPFKLGHKVHKTFRVVENQETVPIGIREIFPKGGQITLPDEFTVKASLT